MSKFTKIVENLDGSGTILTTDGKQVKVRYSLAVLRTLDYDPDTDEFTQHYPVSGAIDVYLDEGLIYLMGKHFNLRTDDGRCLEAWASEGDPASRHWEIVASGPKGLVPC